MNCSDLDVGCIIANHTIKLNLMVKPQTTTARSIYSIRPITILDFLRNGKF